MVFNIYDHSLLLLTVWLSAIVNNNSSPWWVQPEKDNTQMIREDDMREKLSYRTAQFLGAGRIAVHPADAPQATPIGTEGEKIIVSVMDITNIFPHDNTNDAPQWWHDTCAQVEQCSTMSTPMILSLPDNSYMVTSPYSENFYQWLITLDSDGVLFDRQTNSIIIDNPVWPPDTAEAMTESGVQSTSVAAGDISPQTVQAKKLAKDAQKAEKAGFTIPRRELFPTDRTLMSHQVDVVKVLAWRGMGLIADDVGSGKSSMFLGGFFSAVQHKVDQGGKFADCFPLVIVTKKALVEPIAREAQAWFNTVRVHVAGSKKKTISGNQKNFPMDQAHIIVCSLSVLHKHVEDILHYQPTGAVFDESHMVKNPDTIRTKAALRLSQWIKDNNDHPYVVCVSATPMPNRPQELWAQLLIAGMSEPVMEVAKTRQSFPARYTTKIKANYSFETNDQKRFEMRYCKGRPGFFGWEAKGSTHEKELRTIMYNNGFIRRKKSEFITPLPPLRQSFVRCTFDDKAQAEYDTAEKEFRDYIIATTRRRARKEQWTTEQMYDEIADKMGKASHSEAIMKMTAVRQLAGKLKIPSVVQWIHKYFGGDPTVVKHDNNDKLIVFAHHKDTQESLINHPDLQQYGVLSIQAGQRNVNDIVDQFQDPNSGKNLLICYSEAREGLTLTAAYGVLVVEIPWSPSWLLQMAGRCWARFSDLYPPHEATIYYAVANVGIDDYLTDMVRKKGLLNKAIIDPEEAVREINNAEVE